jgi:small-conductance mechanosensitive channel
MVPVLVVLRLAIVIFIVIVVIVILLLLLLLFLLLLLLLLLFSIVIIAILVPLAIIFLVNSSSVLNLASTRYRTKHVINETYRHTRLNYIADRQIRKLASSLTCSCTVDVEAASGAAPDMPPREPCSTCRR